LLTVTECRECFARIQRRAFDVLDFKFVVI
jgi:hypothetical protein